MSSERANLATSGSHGSHKIPGSSQFHVNSAYFQWRSALWLLEHLFQQPQWEFIDLIRRKVFFNLPLLVIKYLDKNGEICSLDWGGEEQDQTRVLVVCSVFQRLTLQGYCLCSSNSVLSCRSFLCWGLHSSPSLVVLLGFIAGAVMARSLFQLTEGV